MPIELLDGRCKIYQGHVLDALRQVPDESVHCIVTSPPYFGLRAYKTSLQIWDGDPLCEHQWSAYIRKGTTGGKASAKVQIKGEENFQIVPDSEQAVCDLCGSWRGELGSEPEPAMFVGHLVQVFQECRRILHPSGVMWVNIGDSYAGNRGYQVPSTKGGPKHAPAQGASSNNRVPEGLKPKDKMGIPWMLAEALRDDGWYLRSEFPWIKPNAMPSSVTDRPTAAHEHWFLFTKSSKCFYDHVAVMRPATMRPQNRNTKRADHPKGDDGRPIYSRPEGGSNPGQRFFRTTDPFLDSLDLLIAEQSEYLAHLEAVKARILAPKEDGGLLLDEAGDPLALIVNTRGYKGAHFATFGVRLIEPLIRAGTSERGVCSECGNPWKRIVETNNPSKEHNTGPDERYEGMANMGGNHQTVAGLHRNSNGKSRGVYSSAVSKGWQPTCTCNLDNIDFEPDDMEIIETPTGERAGDDPSLITGRAGMNRPRGEGEGQRPITRYEQRRYAAQLRISPQRAAMERDAGTAFDHYIRTDRSGARPVPQDMLDNWISRGWIERVDVPAFRPHPSVPATVLDPFHGSGTTSVVALNLHRNAVGCELNQEYVEMSIKRIGKEVDLRLSLPL